MSYTDVFGGSTIYPSNTSYLALTIDADVEMSWPMEANPGATVVAAIIDVTASEADLSILMPDATQTGPGQSALFNNVGAEDVFLKTSTGVAIATLEPGTQWEVYLVSNATASGTWRAYQMGASTATVQPSELAGPGLTVLGSQLAQEQQASTFNSDYTFGLADRASVYVWTGGVGTLNLMAAADAGNGWFASVRNEGTGNLTIDPSSSELINGDSTLVLVPGDSAQICTDGSTYWTIGLGQDPVFAFDYTSIDLTGETSPYVLAGAELNRIAYQFVGTLTEDMIVQVPSTTQQYWVANDTTGAFTLSLATSGQVSPPGVNQGSRGIYYSNGTSVIKADTSSIALPIGIVDGGTGATTASAARVNLGGTATGIAVFTAANAAAARTGMGAAAAGANSDITSLTALSTPLSVAQGGTGAGAFTNGQLLIGKTSSGGLDVATLTAGSGISITNGAGSITIAATGGGGSVTSVAVSGGTTGLTTSGGPITGAGTITLAGTLVVANGGTGATSLTGLVKGNGTSAMTAAVDGTDYVGPSAAVAFTVNYTGIQTALGFRVRSASELTVITGTALNGTVNIDVGVAAIYYATSNATGNFVINLRGNSGTTFNTFASTNDVITVAILCVNGATARYCTSLQIDGTTSGVTIEWEGGNVPSGGNANSIDVYTFTVIKTASATYTVLASRVQYA